MEQEKEHAPVQETSPAAKREGWVYKTGRWIVRIIFTVFVLFLLLALSIQIPAVQNRVVRYAANELSERLGTEVSIQRLSITFFDRVLLDGFYVEDPECDTLFYADKLTANINTNFIDLIRSGLGLDELSLSDAVLHVNRPQGAERSNLQWFLDQFASRKEKEEKKTFQFRIKRLNLNNLTYTVADDVKGNRMWMQVPKGTVQIDKMDLPGKILEVNKLTIEKPVLHLESYTGYPLLQPLQTALGSVRKEADTSSWHMALKSLDIRGGVFTVHNYRKAPLKTTRDDVLDFNHLEVFDIGVKLSHLNMDADTLRGVVNKIAARTGSGFALEQLAVKELLMASNGIELNGMSIKTPGSSLGDTLRFSFENFGAFADFTSSVGMDVRFNETSVSIADIMTFAPALEKNAFFQNNRNSTLRILGRARGTVNDLSGRGLEIALGDGAFMRGRLDLRDVTIPGQGYFGLSLQEARTSMAVLKQIIPRFNLPDSYDRLGRLQFRGDINGFFATGFTMYGNLRTNLGIADLDMTLNPNGGKERATYSGNLSLQDFDLGAWANNPDFGKVSLSASVREGRSLEAATASAGLSAQLRSFSFKKYEYKNATLSGSLKSRFFKGVFAIQDENVNFTFDGSLNYSGEVPVFNFKANLRKIDLKELNLSKKDIIVAGKMNLDIRDDKISTAEGKAHITNLHITLDQDETFSMEVLDIESKFTGPDTKIITVDSDVIKACIDGRFETDQLPGIFLEHLYRNHTGFAQRLKIKPPTRSPAPARFDFEIDIIDTKGFNHLVSPKLFPLRDLMLKGRYDETSDALTIDLEVPLFQFGTLRLEEAVFQWKAYEGSAMYHAGVQSTIINDKALLPTPLFLNGSVYKDALRFGLTYAYEGMSALDKIQLDGTLAAVDSNAFSLNFDQANLTLMNRLWLINPENRIVFSENQISISNLILTHENYRIGIDNYGRKGLRAVFMNFDFDVVNKIWEYEPLHFSGPFNVSVMVEDVFKMENIELVLVAECLVINDDDWGSMRLEAKAANLNHRISATFSLENVNSEISGGGYYNLKDIRGQARAISLAENRKDYFHAGFNLSGVPLRSVEYFLPGVITGTSGAVTGEVTINGVGSPNIEGKLVVNDAGFTVDFLKTTYQFDQAIVHMNDNWLFDASGVRVRDKFGHTATILGGIRHTKLKDLRIDAVLNTNRLLALDTQKGDNDQFYGQAIGRGYARFTGPIDRIDAYIQGTVNDSSRLVIPISSAREVKDIKYVNFASRRSKTVTELGGAAPPSPKGMNIEMELTIGREAVMQLIFNEQTGDILEGSGRGNIRILLPRNGGDFQMFGDVIIEEGDYLFTFYNVINKKFRVQRGGSIRWSGDPYKAIIQLDAEYRGISTPVAGFIAEFIAAGGSQARVEASKSTPVNLILHLVGELFQPQISFDIEFPLLTGELKNYADSKLRLLKQDPNELNRQAFGLIVAGQFLPSDLSVQAPDLIYNTVSEFLSNQFSLLLTDLFSELIADGRVLSGIDFDIAYSQYRPGSGQGNVFGRGEEFEVRLRQNYFNDRLSVVVGGNLDTGGRTIPTPGANSGAFLGNDVVIEYSISADRSLTLKVYQRLQPDIGGRRLKVGAGLSFRKEYDSFGDFLRSIRFGGKDEKTQAGG